jgi:AcrR family transcriptional regulator
MGRHKTISDEAVLAAARRVFQAKGHAASTREIAASVGISEAVLYQRFKNKNALFFASMLPCGPDVLAVLGPPEPPDEARAYVKRVVERMADYFLECVPAGLQVMMHPAFDHAAFAESEPMVGTTLLTNELASRLRRLHGRQRVSTTAFLPAATLLTAIAHDWALHGVLSGSRVTKADRRQLMAMADVVWHGLAPTTPSRVKASPIRASTVNRAPRVPRHGGQK